MSLQKLKTVELLETTIAQARRWFSGIAHTKVFEDRYGTLMGRMIGETNVPYQSPDYELAKQDFRTNLRSIYKKAESAGVPIVISELVSNIRDLAPFASSKSDPALSADVVYRKAQSLEAEGKYDAAHTAYYRAKDLDELRFRASEEFNEVIHQVAAEFKAPVVPMKSYFEAASPHGLIGYNLMLEHLHPNVDGQFIMSEAYFNTLHQQGMIAPQWNEALIKPATYYREHWPVTELDSTLGMLRILNLTDHWPFKPLDSPGHAFRDFQPSDQEQEIAYRVAKNEITFAQGHFAAAQLHEEQGQHEAAQREYQALLAAAPSDYQTMILIARQLIDLKQFDQAMTYLMASLRLKDTAYANKWIGQINLYHRKPQLAQLFLEKAVSMEPIDPQSLYNLSGAYLLTGQLDKARETAEKLEKIKADYPGLARLKQSLDRKAGKAPPSP